MMRIVHVHPSGEASSGSPATASGCLDRDGISDVESTFLAAGQLDDASVTPNEILPAARAGAPSSETVGSLLSVLSDETELQGFSSSKASNHTIATMSASFSARASADFESFERDRVAGFKCLGVGDSRIGHVGVNRIRAIRVLRRPRPARDRFVITERLVTEEQIVHGALAARGQFECKQEGVGDSL